MIIFTSGTRFLPAVLIRSNMSCQIRLLINQGRDQSSPLTDGEMEAGHFLPTSLTFSSAINRKQNKTGFRRIAEAQRVYKGLRWWCLPAAGKWSVSATPHWENWQTSVPTFLFKVLHKCMWSNPSPTMPLVFLKLFFNIIFEAISTKFKVQCLFLDNGRTFALDRSHSASCSVSLFLLRCCQNLTLMFLVFKLSLSLRLTVAFISLYKNVM